MGKVEWTDLPEELVDLIASRSSSNTVLLRIRSICKPWRSAVATKKRFNRFKRNLRPFTKRIKKTELLPSTFFRVTQASSSCPKKGWLIKTRQISESKISQSYNFQCLDKEDKISHEYDSSRVVFVDNHVFLIDENKKIWCCKSGEEGSSNQWTRIKNEDFGEFLDIILHNGQVYALDLKGAVWWISLSDLNISQYGPSTPTEEYYEIDHCKDKRLVEYCGDLCILHRFYKKVTVEWYSIHKTYNRTYNFKVYKMDEELGEWVEVSSLEDKALIVDEDSCFTVLASEFHGCLKNAVYFFDDGDIYGILKLDDRSIINMTDSSPRSCFQMFSFPFL
ncbi:unnamed protein product [Arabis nemorensis]|uniref:Uncharacterized protein n=1 Tax=Arabis nemorensis TaxID=586526 RepID=A0A565C8Y1_9BRAS|nr:unnamed protein product [Arabis nemorensis]